MFYKIHDYFQRWTRSNIEILVQNSLQARRLSTGVYQEVIQKAQLFTKLFKWWLETDCIVLERQINYETLVHSLKQCNSLLYHEVIDNFSYKNSKLPQRP